MKIITKNKPWSMQVECTGKGNDFDNAKKGSLPCNTTLEVNGNDLFQTHSLCSFDNETTYYITFKCPCCGSLTDLTREQVESLPSSVYEYARTRTENDIDCEAIANNSL